MAEKTQNRDRQTMKNLQAKTDIINKLEDKASKVLVLSLGSYSIKMGFANQKAAFSIYPYIAYKKKNSVGSSPMKMEQQQKRQEQIDTQLFNKEYLDIENYLKEECVISADSRPTKGKPRAKQTIPMKGFPEFAGHQEVLYSEEALVVQDMTEEYVFKKAIAHGQLNIADNSPEQLKSCIIDIENLLKYMLKMKLQIPETQWKTFSCIIVLPDVFIRSHMKSLISMIFHKIGFNRVYLHLESILACLGTVTSSAVVVDIGHEKINVCCVDQGIILPKTLVRKNYGLKHISKVLIKLINNRLTEEGLQLSINNQGDQYQVDQYKEACLSIKQPEEVLNKIYEIKPVRKSKQITVPVQYGDNVCISGNTIFTKLWNSIPNAVQFYQAFDPSSQLYGLASDPEDYFEQFSGGGHFYQIQQDNPCYSKELVNPFIYVPIQELVVASIMSIKDHQLKKKFLGSILVIGGGGCVPQLGDQLMARVSSLLKEEQFEEKAQLAGDLIVREIDASHASWLGGTVLPKLDSLRDLWIEKSKFIGTIKQQINQAQEESLLDKKLFTRKEQSQQWGLRYLKQKVPFLW